jgi:hypothetical protein
LRFWRSLILAAINKPAPAAHYARPLLNAQALACPPALAGLLSMPPSIVFYTNRLVGKAFAGAARGPFIFIRPQFKGDQGLLEHERVHVRQFWRTFGLHGLLYRFSRAYRLRSEVEAYRRQLEFTPGNRTFCAAALANGYDLRITLGRAYALLS